MARKKKIKTEELTFKDRMLKSIVYCLVAIILLQIIFNWDKILLFYDWLIGA